MKRFYRGQTILLLLAATAVCIQTDPQCESQYRKQCSKVKDSFQSSGYNDISFGTCEFKNGFCNYTQQCDDSWEIINGSAQVQSKGGTSFVLVSPLIYISYNSCLIVNSTIANQSQLDIALIKNDTKCTLENITSVQKRANNNVTLLIEGPAYIKILFRVDTSGDSTYYDPSNVRLHSVQLDIGNCLDPNCNFQNQCNWTGINWWINTTGSYAKLKRRKECGTLTTLLTRHTFPNCDCLKFNYVALNSTLTVYLNYSDGRTLAHWTTTSNTTKWGDASFTIFSNAAFWIVFEGVRNKSLVSTVRITNVTYLRNTSCTPMPPGAYIIHQYNGTQCTSQSTPSTSETTYIATSSSLHHSTSATQNATSQSVSSTCQSTFLTMSSTLHNGTSDYAEISTAKSASNHVNTGTIVGPIIGVIVIVAVVIFAAVAWKKRRNTIKRTNSIENDLRNDFHVTVESTERDTTNISPKGCRPIYSSLDIEQPDTHTYDQIPQGGDSGKSSCLMASDHYDPGEPQAGSDAFTMHSLNGINDESNLNCKKQREQQGGAPVHMLAQNRGHKQELTDETTDEYNRTDLEDRTTGNRSDDTTLNKLPERAHVPVYSLAQNRGHKPEITDDIDAYNRIDLEGHTSVNQSGDTTLNVYNKLPAKAHVPVYSLAQNTGHKPEITDETTNEYNRIDLEGHTSGNQSRDTTLNVYNKLPAKVHVPVYSLAQNTGHKPEITDETTNEYNRIDLEGHTSGNQSGDTTLNVYNKLPAKAHVPVYSLAQNTGHKPEITDETTNEYNRIDLEGHTSGNQSGDTTLNVYNKLQTKASVPVYSLVKKSGQEKDITDATLGECNITEREQETPGKKAGDKLVSPLYDVPPNRNNEFFKPVMPQDDYNKL